MAGYNRGYILVTYFTDGERKNEIMKETNWNVNYEKVNYENVNYEKVNMKKKRDINNKRRNTEQNKIIKTTFK